MARRETARVIELLQSARPMRLFRNCRYLSRSTIDELLTLTADAEDPALLEVGDVVRNAKQAPLTDGRRVRNDEIDALLSRLAA